MITSSIVTYKTKESDIRTVIRCAIDDCIDKIYIVDNSPTNELQSIVCSMSDRIEYIFGHGNIGYGAGHNIAIKKAMELGSIYHVVLNPDIYFDKGVIPELANYMDAHQDIGNIMPKVLYPNGELQYLCKLLPSPFVWFARMFIPVKTFRNRLNYNFEMRFTNYDDIMNVPYLSGCFMFLRISILKDVGLFDEEIFMYGEDTDLNRRIYQKYKTIYYPYVNIIHAHAKESHKNRRLLWIHIKATIYYLNKWGWIFDLERNRINKHTIRKYSQRR